MAEAAVSSVLQKLGQLIVQEAISLRGIGRDFKEIKDELESIQAFLKDADRMTADDEGGQVNERVKIWVKQLREASFRIEDVIDEYNMYEASQIGCEIHSLSGLIALLQNISHKIPTLKYYQLASEIHNILLSVAKISERSLKYGFKPGSGSSSSREITAGRYSNSEMDSYFNQEVVGFESQRDELVGWLVGGTSERTLISVVGMGGLGKTTLAKHVFDNQLVKNHFDCRFYISASQSNNTKQELLIGMIKKFCEDSNEPVPLNLKDMDDIALVEHVRQYLEPKRYLVWFDDVRKAEFSDGIAHAMAYNNRGSRIVVTTRNKDAAEKLKVCFSVHIHELKHLPKEKALELFCKKAFSFSGQCPPDLEKMSEEIVEKCGGLPLAIVIVGGILSTKPKTFSVWEAVSKDLGMGLDGNVRINQLTTILSRSYDDLPWHLKSCMLYFGIYPENYTINCKRLTGQWIAEGFVMPDGNKTLEEVAEEYLKELIQTSLVQVSSVGIDGKVKSCKVHNLLRDIIIMKMRDLSFCHIMYDDHDQDTVKITRRFSIATFSNNVLTSNSNSGIRAIIVFNKAEFPEYFISNLSIKFKLIKVVDFEHSLLNYVPENIGSLFHLKYLNLSHTKVKVLPRSIGNLVNLETLDLRQTEVHELPMEINKLTMLRLLPVYYKRNGGNYSAFDTKGVKMQQGIKGLKSLQKLYFLEADHGGIALIQELKTLKNLKKLGIRCVKKEHGKELCAAIQEMKFLESLNITAKDANENLELDFVSDPPLNFRVVNLKAKLRRFPDWIPKLGYLVKLMLAFCKFDDDPLDSLKNLQNLSWLILWDDAIAGDSLHFQVGGFHELKELDLTRLNKLSSVSIGTGALPALEYFSCHGNPELKVLPSDLQYLENLKYLGFADMPKELVDSIDPNEGGTCHSIINHIPRVQVREKVESRFHEYDWRRIPTLLHV
ncbi:hypothetical protein P8452_19127 [Trifolium repens]|nr:hypothetical protein P8452_19127 [Trifolium repens]